MSKEPALLLFSGGKDSIVCGDMLFNAGITNVIPVFLYFVKGLSFKQRILDYYEKRWQVKVAQYPHPRAVNLKADKKYKLADAYRTLRYNYNVSWIIEGSKKTDGMARRGMMAHLTEGIDERNRRIYPLADWNDQAVRAYIRINRLALPVEYQHGFKRDISIPTISKLVYLKHNFYDDYQKIIAEFPNLAAMVWNEES